ncbi:hypothetical protein BsIDN1_66580 [Bacillus safensis]|uniref:Uncharacterized protein n=1 Tax=Bacillus safensis TaxID=561879 RepID=A0A5S9MHW8_BACIA|nr:hypothetical protein BsIDN1_66580 [Bacillus safensis]
MLSLNLTLTTLSLAMSFFREKLRKDIVQFIDVIDQIEMLFQMQPIAAVIVGTTEDVYSRVLALQTVKRQLTSICLQHGALMGDEAFFTDFYDLPWGVWKV